MSSENIKNIEFDASWTLFLDRDGVINHRIVGDYVKKVDEFRFFEDVPQALVRFGQIFGRVVVVTNQQGIAKGLMTETDLARVHRHLVESVAILGGRLDGIYFAPDRSPSPLRKPDIGMGLAAKSDFSDINFERSVMVGDSISDMEFGKRLGMKTIWLTTKGEMLPPDLVPDAIFDVLTDFLAFISPDGR